MDVCSSASLSAYLSVCMSVRGMFVCIILYSSSTTLVQIRIVSQAKLSILVSDALVHLNAVAYFNIRQMTLIKGKRMCSLKIAQFIFLYSFS